MAGAGDLPALGPPMAGTLAPFGLGTRKINFLASAQCRLVRIWHNHPFVCRRGQQKARVALWFPGEARGHVPGSGDMPGRLVSQHASGRDMGC